MSGILVRGGVLRVLLLAGLVFAALPAASALADTTVGQTGTPVSIFAWSGGYERVQTDAAMPAPGVVTSFHTQASSVCGLGAGTYDFQVLRPLGGDQYLVRGDTGDQTDPCDGQLHSYPVNIPVEAGDVIGVYTPSAWEGVLSSPGNVSFNEIPEPVVGATVTLPNSLTATVDESATLSIDIGGLAAMLVSDSSGLPPGKALINKATAIQTEVNAEDTTTACADLTDFLGLVKAQTDKKLNTTQAATLTTDANSLAVALGC